MNLDPKKGYPVQDQSDKLDDLVNQDSHDVLPKDFDNKEEAPSLDKLEQEELEQQDATKSNQNLGKIVNKNNLLLIVGPLFLLGSLLVSMIITSNAPQQSASTYPVEEQVANLEEYRQYAPTNPTVVRAYADQTKVEELQTGNAYSYENPYFEWDRGVVNDPGAVIDAYMVYFGENLDENDLQTTFYALPNGVLVRDNHFSPLEHGIYLQQGKTYYLLVQAFSNGKAQAGFDRELNVPSRIYFTYIYQ